MKKINNFFTVMPVVLAIMMLPAIQACTSEDEPKQSLIEEGPIFNEIEQDTTIYPAGYCSGFFLFDIAIDIPGVLHQDSVIFNPDVMRCLDVITPKGVKTMTITPDISKNLELDCITFATPGFEMEKITDKDLAKPYKFACGATVTRQADGSYLYENLPDYFNSILYGKMDARVLDHDGNDTGKIEYGCHDLDLRVLTDFDPEDWKN